MTRRRCGRRALLGALAAGGTAALSGCSVLGGDEDDPAPLATFAPETARAVLSPAAPTPDPPVSVTPAAAAVDAGLARVDDLLATVPRDLSPETIPNGVVRAEIADQRREARRQREDVVSAPTPSAALEVTRDARQTAARAAWSHRAATGDATMEAVQADLSAVRDDLDAAVSAVPYAGTDRARTVLLAAEVEATLDAGRRVAEEPPVPVDPNALEVGRAAGRAESGRAAVDVATHLSARHRARVDDPTAFGAAIERAVSRTLDALGKRDLPSADEDPAALVDADVGRGPAYEALRTVLWGVESIPDHASRHAEADLSALALRTAYAAEQDARAFEAVRERVEAGDLGRLESVDPVRRARETAIERAREVSVAGPSVPAWLHATVAATIGEVDRHVREAAAEREAVELAQRFAEYVWTAERLAALPEAVAAVEAGFED